MADNASKRLARVLHAVNTKCANLKGGAGLLRGEDSQKELKLLTLMCSEARSLADELAAYASERKSQLS